MSIADFCREQQVPTGSFYLWRRRLGTHARRESAARSFVRLEPMAKESGPEADPQGGLRVKFACGASLHCPAVHLEQVVRLLLAGDREAQPC